MAGFHNDRATFGLVVLRIRVSLDLGRRLGLAGGPVIVGPVGDFHHDGFLDISAGSAATVVEFIEGDDAAGCVRSDRELESDRHAVESDLHEIERDTDVVGIVESHNRGVHQVYLGVIGTAPVVISRNHAEDDLHFSNHRDGREFAEHWWLAADGRQPGGLRRTGVPRRVCAEGRA